MNNQIKKNVSIPLAVLGVISFLQSTGIPSADAQQYHSFADQSKFTPGLPEANRRFVVLNSGVAAITEQKFKLPTDTFRFPVAGMVVFPYYEATPQLKEFLNNATTLGGMPLTSFPTQPNMGAFSLPATDLTHINFPIPHTPNEKRAAVKMAILDKRRKDEVPWMVAHDSRQAFGIPGDNDGIVMVSPGTMFSATLPRTMVLRCGIMWIMTGVRPAAVLTKNGVVAVKPFSIAAVEQTWFNRLRAANLAGQPLEIQLSYRGQASRITVERGQERTISENTVASAGTSDYVDPAKTTGAATDAQSSPLPGLSMTSEKIQRDTSTFLKDLETLTPPFSNTRMDADFQHMFSAYGISPAMRKDAIDKQVLQRHELAGKPALNKLARTAAAAEENALAGDPKDQPVKFPQVSDELKSMRLRQATVKYLSNAEIEVKQQNGHLALKSGEALVAADQSMVVDSGEFSIYLRPGAAVHLVAKNGVIAVKNVKESEPSSVKIRYNHHIFDCGVGGELIVGNNAPDLFNEMRKDGVGRRHLQSTETGGGTVIVNKSEVELASLMQYSPLMRKLYKSHETSDRMIVQDLMKTIVSLNMVTQGHGGYQRMAGSVSSH